MKWHMAIVVYMALYLVMATTDTDPYTWLQTVGPQQGKDSLRDHRTQDDTQTTKKQQTKKQTYLIGLSWGTA